jgi:hypothetical protein
VIPVEAHFSISVNGTVNGRETCGSPKASGDIVGRSIKKLVDHQRVQFGRVGRFSHRPSLLFAS